MSQRFILSRVAKDAEAADAVASRLRTDFGAQVIDSGPQFLFIASDESQQAVEAAAPAGWSVTPERRFPIPGREAPPSRPAHWPPRQQRAN